MQWLGSVGVKITKREVAQSMKMSAKAVNKIVENLPLCKN